MHIGHYVVMPNLHISFLTLQLGLLIKCVHLAEYDFNIVIIYFIIAHRVVYDIERYSKIAHQKVSG